MLAKPQGFPRKLGGCAGLDPRLRSAVSAGVGDGERGLRRGLRAPGVGVRPKWVLEYSPSNKRIRYFVSITYVRTGLWTAHKFCGGGETFNLCKQHDFDYFQGLFFCSPNRRPSRKVPVNRLAAVRVLAELQDPEISINQLAVTISHDLSLSYKLLRYTNSAYIGLSRQVESISHAAKMIGIERIRVWASLLMVAKMKDKPRELMTTAIVRAAMCERLATSAKAGRKETFFTVGLLSLVDALLDLPMAKAIDKLPLSDEVCDALILHKGRLGQALNCVLAYERGDWDQVQFEGLPGNTVRGHYLDSVGWARQISDGLLI